MRISVGCQTCALPICLQGRLIHAVLYCRQYTGNAAFDLGERFAVKFGVRAALVVLAVELFRIGAHSVGHGIGGNELLRQSGQNAALDVVAADGMPIIAGAAAITVQATISVTGDDAVAATAARSEEHTSELQSLMRISYAVFSL